MIFNKLSLIALVGALRASAAAVDLNSANVKGLDAWHLDNLYALAVEQLDPIVTPNAQSSHMHRILGGSNFAAAYNGKELEASACTTAAVTVDHSAYWAPQLYWIVDPENPDNTTFMQLPSYNRFYYFLGRNDFSQPVQAWPEGFKMVAGEPGRKTVNPIYKYYCHRKADLSDEIASDHFNFEDPCLGGIKFDLSFPSCWDGVNLYKSDNSHMTYPVVNLREGPCPISHPVRLPSILLEYTYHPESHPAITKGQNVKGHLAWANGDTTGFGLHADFIMGWDRKILTEALNDPRCVTQNMSIPITECPVLNKYFNINAAKACKPARGQLAEPFPQGDGNVVPKMPGCNPLWGATGPKPTCATPPPKLDISAFKSEQGPDVLPVSEQYDHSIPTTQGWHNLGCYHNQAMFTPAMVFVDNKLMTPERCQDSCKRNSYSYAALTASSGFRCFCDNKLNMSAGIQLSGCQVPCPTGEKTCGGEFKLDTFYQAPAHVAPDTSVTDLGCYKLPYDWQSDNLVKGAFHTFNSKSMTRGLCASTCMDKGAAYSATRDTSCYCGAALKPGPGYFAPSDICTRRCGGNSSEICGDFYSLSVQNLSPVPMPEISNVTQTGTSSYPVATNTSSIQPTATPNGTLTASGDFPSITPAPDANASSSLSTFPVTSSVLVNSPESSSVFSSSTSVSEESATASVTSIESAVIPSASDIPPMNATSTIMSPSWTESPVPVETDATDLPSLNATSTIMAPSSTESPVPVETDASSSQMVSSPAASPTSDSESSTDVASATLVSSTAFPSITDIPATELIAPTPTLSPSSTESIDTDIMSATSITSSMVTDSTDVPAVNATTSLSTPYTSPTEAVITESSFSSSPISTSASATSTALTETIDVVQSSVTESSVPTIIILPTSNSATSTFSVSSAEVVSSSEVVSTQSSSSAPIASSSATTSSAAALPTTTGSPLPLYEYRGCVQDGSSRVLNATWTYSGSKMTPEFCYNIAKQAGKKLFGIEGGIECFVGDTLVTNKTATGCNTPCSGNKSISCGGPFKLAVWSTELTPVVESSQSTITPILSPTYVPGLPTSTLSSTSTESASTIESYPSSISSSSTASDTSRPSDSTPDASSTTGVSSSATSGAADVPAVSTTTLSSASSASTTSSLPVSSPEAVSTVQLSSSPIVTSTSATSTSAVALPTSTNGSPAVPYVYRGCVQDGTPRVLNATWTYSGSKMTPDFCYNIAKQAGKKLFGIQGGIECFVGDSLITNKTATGCNTPCSGNKTLSCGGTYRLSVWSTELTPLTPVLEEPIRAKRFVEVQRRRLGQAD